MNYRLIKTEDIPDLIEVRATTRENPFSREALRQIGVTEESVAVMLQISHRGWLCEVEGKIVGFAIGDGKTGELWVIAVLPDFEGKGIGSRLLGLVEEWLWSLGWQELWLWTSPDTKTRAFTFYSKHGWSVSETKSDALYFRKRATMREGSKRAEIVERLRSVHLQNERRVWIRQPANPSTVAALTIFLDGELYRDRVGAVSVIDELISQGRIANSWIVFVSTESIEARWRECPCHAPFAKFMVDELLPWLERQHPEIGAARYRVLAGLSYTGLAAAFIAREHPGVFQKVISQSGSFWFNDCWLVAQFEELKRRAPTEYYLDVGLRETQENVRHREDVLQVVSQITGVRKFRDALLRQGYSVRYVEFDGGHEFEAWRKSLPEALAWALPNSPS